MGVVLYIISLILVYILSFPFIIYSMIRVGSFREAGTYFFELAQSVDQFGNAMGRHVFNDLFVKEGGHPYGNIDETISGVTGRNFEMGTLTNTGVGFKNILDRVFGKDHCVSAIGARLNNTK